jgi:hypothetical protein
MSVQTAVDMLEFNGQPADVRYHEATGVLIARGSKKQVDAIDDVVGPFVAEAVLNGIFGGAADAGSAGDDLLRTLEGLQRQLADLRERLERLERRRARD